MDIRPPLTIRAIFQIYHKATSYYRFRESEKQIPTRILGPMLAEAPQGYGQQRNWKLHNLYSRILKAGRGW